VTRGEIEEAREVFLSWTQDQDPSKVIELESGAITISHLREAVISEDKFGKELIYALISEVRRTKSSIHQVVLHL